MVDMREKPDTMGEQSPPVKPPKVATGYKSDDIQDIAEKISRLTGEEAKDLERYLKIKIEEKSEKG